MMCVGVFIVCLSVVICIGMNYVVYVVEFGFELFIILILFFKMLNMVVGLDDIVMILCGSEKMDWEVELGVVIGKCVVYLDFLEELMVYVVGFVVVNDVFECDF